MLRACLASVGLCVSRVTLQCTGSLLYSSRTATDVLCIDELRKIQEQGAGRVRVRHTLTDQPDTLTDQPYELEGTGGTVRA